MIIGDRLYALFFVNRYRSRALIRRFSISLLWKTSSPQKQTTIPQWVESIVHFLSRGNHAENILGDLQEHYAVILESSSLKRARIWLYKQLLRSAVPFIYTSVRQSITSRLGELISRR